MSNAFHRGKSRRRPAIIALIALISTVGISTAAYAYWSTTGAGTGSATTGTTQNIVVNQTTTVTGLAPGLAPVALTGTFNNPNPNTVRVGNVTATVSVPASAVGCSAADYAITGTGTPGNGGLVPSGNAQGSWSGLSIAFANDPARNQDACKTVAITINYSVAITSTTTPAP
jgi:hypothetical protein